VAHYVAVVIQLPSMFGVTILKVSKKSLKQTTTRIRLPVGLGLMKLEMEEAVFGII
jgi:hypothetical protein